MDVDPFFVHHGQSMMSNTWRQLQVTNANVKIGRNVTNTLVVMHDICLTKEYYNNNLPISNNTNHHEK